MKTTGRYIIAAIAVFFSISISFNASGKSDDVLDNVRMRLDKLKNMER